MYNKQGAPIRPFFTRMGSAPKKKRSWRTAWKALFTWASTTWSRYRREVTKAEVNNTSKLCALFKVELSSSWGRR